MDPKTLKKLERLKELRQKYINYKNELEKVKLEQAQVSNSVEIPIIQETSEQKTSFTQTSEKIRIQILTKKDTSLKRLNH